MENPYIRVEDISAAVDFLTTLPYVDNNRIGGLGICAGGGYMAAAAMRDRRIKAVGTVSAVNIGEGFRYSWGGHETPDSQNLIGMLENVGQTRTAQVNGGELVYIPLTPQSKEGITLPDMLEAIDYYWTPRAQHPRAVSRMLLVDLAQQATFDAFHLVEQFLTQPLLIVAGTAANTLWFSEELYRRAGAKDSSDDVSKYVADVSLPAGTEKTADADILVEASAHEFTLNIQTEGQWIVTSESRFQSSLLQGRTKKNGRNRERFADYLLPL